MAVESLFKPNFDTVEAMLRSAGPAALHEQRLLAWSRFEKAGLPTTKDEEFKYFPLNHLGDEPLAPSYGSTILREDLKNHPLRDFDVPTATFVNGQYAPELTNLSGLPEGCVVLSLAEALANYSELVTQYLGKAATLEGKLGSTNDERFTDLNTAFLAEGLFILVKKSVALDKPIFVNFLNRADHGRFASHPRIVIVLEENAQASVIECHFGLDENPYFANPVTEVFVAESANLEHTRWQLEGSNSTHVALVYANQKQNSTYTNNNVSFGAKRARCDVNVYIDGEHTETALNGAYAAKGEQVIDNHTRIDHAKPNCHSFEVYKGILDDKGTGVFNGKIFVYEDAQKTDAKQTNQALLLSPNAQINTKPQLEIFADDVKCTHGATVGQIREDAMFYLRSRGIPEAEARGLLVYAFVAEVLEKVSNDQVREAMEAKLFEKLSMA